MDDASARTSTWIVFRRSLNIVLLIAIAAWWALFDSQRLLAIIPKVAVRFPQFDPAVLRVTLFLGIPAGTIFVLQLSCYVLDRTFIGRRWTSTDVMRLGFWRTVTPTVTLLFVATGFDAMYDRKLVGILWLISAAILAMVGAFRLRVAEGIKLQRVKSGDLYKRAFVMAKDMRTPLKRVYVVPAGRGHLTNAYGLSESIAVTDNYGKFLDRAELDFVIGHELGHVKGKHGRKKLLIMVLVFATLAAICFFFPSAFIRFRPLLNFFLLLLPMLTFYFFSRRFEYAADKNSVEFTHDSKAAIRALDNLYGFTQAPTRCNTITELFQTHPSLKHRAAAIAGIVPEARRDSELLPQLKDD